MKIGQLASRSGRSVHTLRYYEAQRLMPNVERDPAGRRIYTERHIAWLELLSRLRASGMSITDMRAYTALVTRGDSTLGERQAFLRAHRARVAATVRDLTSCLVLIDSKIALYGRWIKTGRSGPKARVRRDRNGASRLK